MSRPQHPFAQPPSDGSASSFGGLADVLEPDADEVTSMHRVGVASVRHPSLPPVSSRAPAPIQIQDFAFADTIVARELADDEAPPPSGPIYVHDPDGNTQCVTPLAFRLPSAAEDVDVSTRMRVTVAHARDAVRRSVEEMRELWAGTAEMVGGQEPGALRRVLLLWSCFQWSRADFTRAAMIGVAVFITAAAIGASTMDLADGGSAAAGAGVRAARTIDQHTGKKIVLHGKR